MGVSLSIKDVPEALAERLRKRAARNHRSLQRELMAIIEAATEATASSRALTVASPVPAYSAVKMPEGKVDESNASSTDNLLAELDAIVADSRWGSAPLLTREQAHDRRLQRELEYDSRHAEASR